MILHWLVEIQTLKNRRIETGEQFARYDYEFDRRQRITEFVKQFLFLIAATFVFFIIVSLVSVGVHHYDSLVIGAEKCIESLLVFDAAVAVIHHNLSLHTIWLNLVAEVIDNVLADFVNAFLSSEKSLN